MAVKYIVIPEDMYKSLIKTQPEVKIGIDQAKTQLDKVKKARNKNLSTKNILYNQELRRYLKTRKEEEEKPVKVEISNGLQGILKRVSPTPQAPSGRRRLLSLSSQFDPNNDESVDTEYETPHSTIHDFESTLTTPTLKDTRYDRLVDIIMTNPGKYGVEDGIILNTKLNPIGTDFRDALKHHLQPFNHTYSPGSPQGTHLLISRLNKDPKAKRILDERPVKTTPPSTKRRRHRQTGKGIIKRNKKSYKTISKFEPRLWMRS